MALFDWSDRFSVGIREMDEQHMKLVEILNTLHDAMRQGKGKDMLGKVLEDLVQYTVFHFTAEEKIMRMNGFPALDEHIGIHEDLKKKVIEVREKFEKNTLMLSIEVMQFLKDWLVNHINGTDKKYGSYLNDKGVR